MTCLPIRLTVFFTEQNFATVMKSSLSILPPMGCTFGDRSKNSSPLPRSSRFSPVILWDLYSFALYRLICDLFWVTFYEGCKVCVCIHLFSCGCLVGSAPFVVKTIVAPLYRLCSFVKISWHYYVGLFLGCVFCSIELPNNFILGGCHYGIQHITPNGHMFLTSNSTYLLFLYKKWLIFSC